MHIEHSNTRRVQAAQHAADLIVDLTRSPDRLAAMAAAASGEGRPDAVERLADLVEFIASGGKPADFSPRETRP